MMDEVRIPPQLLRYVSKLEEELDQAEAEVARLRMRVSSLETQWAESDTAAAIFQAMSRAEAAEAMLQEEHDARMEALAQRDEARATKDMHKERQEEAWAEVERLRGSVRDDLRRRFGDATRCGIVREKLTASEAEVERLRDEIAAVKTDNYRINRHRDECEAEVERLRGALENP
jgi:vacuolar-type H+-ATPase subunit I/STV1